MGQGEETKTRPDPNIEIQERGEIFFFCRPKVEKEEAHGPEEVQRLYLVLRPESGERPVECKQEGDKKDSPSGGHGSQEVNIEKQLLLRLIAMGRKTLPDTSKKSRPYWGFVEMVTTKIEDLKNALQGGEYDTATRGHRHKPDARAAAGAGVYRILRHKTHTHLVYKLEQPDEEKEAFNIASEASFLLQIKNPDQQGSSSGFRGLQSKKKAAFPAHIQGLFGHRRFHSADPPDFLNYEGCEILLISASDDLDEELGLELKTEQHECSDLMDMLGDAGYPRPLLEGTWA
ncbi:uncharacterized protein LOC142530903 [Primulina tabacum]|uniref:uncharacterized protein LOC142530903 n=1 Tax=Primulina tabacum TaxID=48773 RepID=UPI003F5937A9